MTAADVATSVWSYATRTVDGNAAGVSDGSRLDDIRYGVWTYATRTVAPDALTASNLVGGTPALGAPAAGQVHTLTATGIVGGTPVLGKPAAGQIHVLSALGIVGGTPVLGSPLLTSAAAAVSYRHLGTPIRLTQIVDFTVGTVQSMQSQRVTLAAYLQRLWLRATSVQGRQSGGVKLVIEVDPAPKIARAEQAIIEYARRKATPVQMAGRHEQPAQRFGGVVYIDNYARERDDIDVLMLEMIA